MRRHALIWILSLLALVCALSVALLRQHTRFYADHPGAAASIEKALAALESDPSVWEEATQALVRAVAAEVEAGRIRSAEGYYVLGVQYEREDNLGRSEALFKRAIAEKPGWSRPYAGLGSLLARHAYERTEEAQRALEKAIELDPQWARPHNLLAVLLRQEGRLEAAEKEAKYAVELAPEDIASHNNYANLLVQMKRLEEAKDHYLRATQLNPDHPKPYYNLACLYSLLGEKEKAIIQLREALRRAPILRKDAAGDPDLDPIRDLPEFKGLVQEEPEAFPYLKVD